MALKEYNDTGTKTVKVKVDTTNTEDWWRTEVGKRRVAVKLSTVANANAPKDDTPLEVEVIAAADRVMAGVIIEVTGTGSNFRGTLLYRTAGVRMAASATATTALTNTQYTKGLAGAAGGYLAPALDAADIPIGNSGPIIVGGTTQGEFLIAFDLTIPIV